MHAAWYTDVENEERRLRLVPAPLIPPSLSMNDEELGAVLHFALLSHVPQLVVDNINTQSGMGACRFIDGIL